MVTSKKCFYKLSDHELRNIFVSDMASLFRLGARALARQVCPQQTASRMVIQSRNMGNNPWEGDPPTTTLGGQFKNPV